MSGLLRLRRASFGGSRAARHERGDTALAFAGSLVGLSGTGLGRGAVASARPTSLPAVDGPLLSVVLALVLIGTVMVYSASISLADSPRYNVAPTHFLMRHLLSLGIAFFVAAIAFQIPIGVWQRLAPFVFVGALVLLVVVLIPGVGKGVNGAKRWIPLGVLNLQPSELMKVACVLYAANFTVRKQDYMNHFGKGFLPMAFVMGAIGVLLLLQPDLGAFGVIERDLRLVQLGRAQLFGLRAFGARIRRARLGQLLGRRRRTTCAQGACGRKPQPAAGS